MAETVQALREQFPDAEVLVADDGSRDATAERAEEAGATVVRLPRRGKGQALSAAERAAPPGSLLLCDADLRGDLRPLVAADSELAIAGFALREGRRVRARPGGGADADRAAQRLQRTRAALRPTAALAARAPRRLPARARLRGRDENDGRRAARRAGDRGDRARPRAPADGARPPGVRPPRAAAARSPARVRAARRQLPRLEAAARRLGRRRPGPSRGRGCRGIGPPTTSGADRARVPRAPPRWRDDGRAQARRHPADRAARDASTVRRAPVRARRERAEPARHETGSCAEGVRARGTTVARAARDRRPATALRSSRAWDAG